MGRSSEPDSMVSALKPRLGQLQSIMSEHRHGQRGKRAPRSMKLAQKRVSCSSKAKLPNGDNLNHRLENRSSIEVALVKQGSMKFPFHYSLHIYVASFPLTCTLDLFYIFLDKRKLLHMPFFHGDRELQDQLVVQCLCLCHSYWFLKLSCGQIASQPTKTMIHLRTNINCPMSSLIMFPWVQGLHFSWE